MSPRFVRLLVLPVAVAALALGSTMAAAQTTLWPMSHLDPGHSGNDTGEPSFANMTTSAAWTSGLDGQIFAEPLVDGNNVIVATENDSVYAVNATDGTTVWGPISLGTPRTTFPSCGSPQLISPLGITGTPILDGGFLWVVATIQTASTIEFDLAKMDPATGAVLRQTNVTPAGMDTTLNNRENNRSGLAVSNGNVIVSWGGIVNDCTPYNGYIELASEATGSVVNQFVAAKAAPSPAGDDGGGMWASAGAAVDGAGNIFVATGNGFTTTSSQYDYGNSVLKFNSALQLQSLFTPSNWFTADGSDSDVGSLDPSLTPFGTLFQIGKGGTGYLLNQSALPAPAPITNPVKAGGENHAAVICPTNTFDQAFGGLAVVGDDVFVPCGDRLAQVVIDSASSFHEGWFQKLTIGTSTVAAGPPIVAGGLVWCTDRNGSKMLWGLDPATGAIKVTITMPQTSDHFATPSTGDGRLFIGDGTDLLAYAPPPPPPPPARNLLAVDAFGGLHAVSGSVVSSQPALWNFKIARGVALLPNTDGGYILDGWGGVRAFGSAPPATISAYWQGWDIARGIALLANGTGGYVVDGWGGLHPFKVGAGPMPPYLPNGSYWSGWDIARGVVLLPSGAGGYVLDGWGGVDSFGSAPPLGDSAYWRGWDIARGIVLTTAGGGGYVLDGWGGVHTFGSATYAPASVYWSGQDIARSLVLQPGMSAQGWVLNAAGAIVPFGGAPAVPAVGSSLSFDFRGLAAD